MGSMRQRTIVLLASLCVIGSGLTASPAAATRPAATPAWQLIDYQQKACYVSTRGDTDYYGIWIAGTWTHQITIGATGLPAGGSYYTSYAPIPAGTSDGIGSLAYVDIVLPVGEAVGTYTASMWASDGTTTEAVPITIIVNATSCAHY
jgi:hypothetical protein